MELILQRLHPEIGAQLTLSADECQSVSEAVILVSEEVWNVCRSLGHIGAANGGSFHYPRHLRSVFCSKDDCRRIREAVFRSEAANRQNEPSPEHAF